MAGLRVRIEGDKELLARLQKMNPGLNDRIVNDAMVESMLTILRDAAQNKIKRGGTKGSKPRPKVLTSRTGQLRKSLTLKRASLNKTGLPERIEGGSILKYARVHELGSPKQNIRARPYLAPALADAVKQIPGIFLKHWERQL